MYASHYYESKIIGILRGTSISSISSKYVALFTDDPGDPPDFTKEVSYTGYARKSITFKKEESEGTLILSNTEAITFPNTSATSPVITYIGVFDSSSRGAGNMICYGPLTVSVTNEGGIMFPVGNISWTISGCLSDTWRANIVKPLISSSASGSSTAPYLALYSGDPNAGGIELSGGNYKRVAITKTGMKAATVDGDRSYTENLNTLTFASPTAEWNEVTHLAITVSQTGAVFASFELIESVVPTTGDIVTVPAGSLKMYIG